MTDGAAPLEDRPQADVTVIIIAYASERHIARCLASVRAQTVRPARVVLVENGSPDDRRLSAADMPDWVEFHENRDNLGFAAANNRAAETVATKWIAFLNPDAFPEPDWLEQLLAATERHPEAAFFGSTQLAAGYAGLLDGVGDVYHAVGFPYRGGYGRPARITPPEGSVFSVCAAASLNRRDVFEALGGFDESYFCYCEDVDLCFRGRLLGHEAVQVSDARVHHVGYASTGRYSEFAIYHGTRNRLWTFLKDMPGPLLYLLAPVHAAATLIQTGSALRRGLIKPFLRALRDGLKDWPRIRKERRIVQSARSVPWTRIAGALTWNPIRLAQRAPDVRPVKPQRNEKKQDAK